MGREAAGTRQTGPMIVGLTGGVASGKSTAADVFAECGIPVLDTDEIARDVVVPGSVGLGMITEAFGSGVLGPDGALDRHALREIVFSDPEARRRLEAMLHPLIRDELGSRSRTAGGLYQIHVIPLLVETGMQDAVDRVLVIDCPEAIQRTRLMDRDGESESRADSILAAQSDRAARLAAADDVLLNDADQARLKALVRRLHDFYSELARTGRFSEKGLRLP